MADLITKLQELFDSVHRDGRHLRFWWRDDDAQQNSPELQRLYAISQKTGMPLCLAVIPEGVNADILEQAPDDMVIFQHGIRHWQEQRSNDKKSEFPASRDGQDILNQLLSCRHQMTDMFAARFRPCMTPPWNRFADDHKQVLVDAGFTHLSRYNSPDPNARFDGLTDINTHIDIIEWTNRGYAGDKTCYELIAHHVAAKKDGRADWKEALGVMTHHRDHDQACDDFLVAFFDLVQRHPATSAVDGRTLTA